VKTLESAQRPDDCLTDSPLGISAICGCSGFPIRTQDNCYNLAGSCVGFKPSSKEEKGLMSERTRLKNPSQNRELCGPSKPTRQKFVFLSSAANIHQPVKEVNLAKNHDAAENGVEPRVSRNNKLLMGFIGRMINKGIYCGRPSRKPDQWIGEE
jgi:hypothetical protein